MIHGDADTLVPVAHSRHTADVIPGATFRLLPGYGHFTILEALPSLAARALLGTLPIREGGR